MRISDWSSDVCSSDLSRSRPSTITSISALKKLRIADGRDLEGSSLDVINQLSNERSKQFTQEIRITSDPNGGASFDGALDWIIGAFYYRDRSARRDEFRLGNDRSEEHTSELQSLMRNTYAVFCLK